MTPIDMRNATFDDMRARLSADRLLVWDALLTYGPCTTRKLAEAMVIMDILSVRPRVTELMQIGFVVMEGREGNEGTYRALRFAEAEALFDATRAAGDQMLLKM